MSEFEDFRDRVFTLYSDRQYEELHVLMDGAVERFPNRRSRITYWQACVDSLRANLNAPWSDSVGGSPRGCSGLRTPFIPIRT